MSDAGPLDPGAQAAGDEIVVATYNVEALFDCEKDHEKQDHDYPRAFFERGVKPRNQDLERAGFSDHLPVVTRLRRVGKTR